MRPTIFSIFILFISQFCFAQKPNTYPEYYKKLEFDWVLKDTSKLNFELALTNLRKFEYEKAIPYLTKVIHADSSFLPAFHFRSMCYANVKKTSKSQGDLGYAWKLFPFDLKIYSDLWNKYVFHGYDFINEIELQESSIEIENLGRYLSTNIELHDEHTKRLILKSYASLVTGYLGLSFKNINKINHSNLSASAAYLKAIAFKNIGMQDSAFVYFQTVYELDSLILDVNKNLAIDKSQKMKVEATRVHLQNLIYLDSTSYDIIKFNGLISFSMTDYKESIKYLTSCLNYDPESYLCLVTRGMAMFYIKDYQNAIVDLKNAIDINKNELQPILYLSDSYYEIGLKDQSIEVLKKALSIFSFDQRLDLALAEKYIDTEKYGTAKSILSKVIRVVEFNNFNSIYLEKALFLQSNLYFKRGKYNQALKKINILIKEHLKSPKYVLLRARIYFALNNTLNFKQDITYLKSIDYSIPNDLKK